MIYKQLDIYATAQLWNRGTDVHLVRRMDDGKDLIGVMTWEPIVDGGHPVPSLSLPRGANQNLMDELWRAGLRPTEGSGSAGSLAATEKHLADMRAIVFNKLEVTKP